ncbi:hypothetical protein GGI08_005175 [Coemansia sp. S2]|nr:hypothetical protein GGI08_005175 [Coemansia sp. S2]
MGIKLSGYTLRAIDYADDIIVMLSSEDDVAAFYNAIELHSHASKVKLNINKTEMPAYWDLVLHSWFALKGKGPDETFNGPIESILGLPFDHPAVYLLVEISAATRKKLQMNKLFTLGDIFVCYELTGAAISRDDPLLQPYALAFSQRWINLHPHIVRKLLNYLLDLDRCAVWAHAQLGGVPLEAYTPRQRRRTATSTEVAPIRLDRRERAQVQNQIARAETDITRLSKARWTRLPKIHLETKHLSPLWLMAHAAVQTTTKLLHFIPDLEPVCKYCSAITRSENASDEVEEIESENIAHYF